MDYIRRLDLALELMQRAQDLERVASELVEDMAAENVIYAEVRFAPQLHTRRGLSMEEAVAAVHGALQERGQALEVRTGLIVCALRHQTEQSGRFVAELAASLRQQVCALDLAGDEGGHPDASRHQAAFALAGWEIGRPLPRDARVFVAGSSGLVGSAVARHLRAAGFTDVVGVRSAQVDLRDADATARFLDETRPAVVVDAAARVGGIAANAPSPSSSSTTTCASRPTCSTPRTRVGRGAPAAARLVVHLPEVRRPADPRGLAAHRRARAHQRRVRDREDRRDHGRAVLPPRVRPVAGSPRCRPTSTGRATTSTSRSRTCCRR